MSFVLFTDSAANLSAQTVREKEIHVLAMPFSIGGEHFHGWENGQPFDSKAFFARLRAGENAKTSLLNTETFLLAFEPFLAAGQDVLYVGLSSGISGTFACARAAAEELNAKYEAQVYPADTLSGSYGEGLMVLKAAELRENGVSAAEAAEYVAANRQHLCHFLAVDDLQFLRRGGRLPAMSAAIGTVLHLKPLLYFNSEGKVGVADKIRGKQRLLAEMVKRYGETALTPNGGTLAIVHGDAEADAEKLAAMVRAAYGDAEIILSPIETTTGTHAGPGSLALLFWGRER